MILTPEHIKEWQYRHYSERILEEKDPKVLSWLIKQFKQLGL